LLNGALSAVVDPWFEEGFAEYFSSIEVDSKEARVGKVPEYQYQVLQHDGAMKIGDLFRVRQNSSTYNESGDRRTVFYAESGMLVHYLYDNNLIPKLSTYFTLKIDKGILVEDAIQQSFGMSAAQFDKTLRNYASSGRYKYYAIPTPANIVSKDYALKPLSSADSSAVIADVHLHSLDYHKQAVAEFREILKTEPNHAAACRGLGYAYLEQGDFKQAAEYFQRAVKADSKDPRVHYYSAMLSSREGSFADKSDVEQMIKELGIAISLDPDFADAYSMRAFARSRAGDSTGALVDMQKAISLNPRNERYRFNLAQMYMSNQQPDQATAILEMLQKSGNPEVAQRAGESLAQLQEFKAEVQAARLAAANNISARVEDAAATEDVVVVPPGAPLKFLKGSVIGVDCSAAPSATLMVKSGTKTWTMRVADSKHVLVLGGNEFSCAWDKQKIALNYRETGDGAGTVVSIEIQ
jgi:tetratricopeptide (TPR) repeat protein